MTDYERSMMLEKAFADVAHVVVELKTFNAHEADKAKRDGREHITLFQDWIDILSNVRNVVREESDRAFLKHKETHPVNDDGVYVLANAILERAALDYELALCTDHENARNVQEDIEEFAEKEAHLYTNLDFPDVLESIRDKHSRFVRKAHNDIGKLIYYTAKNKRRGHSDRKYNPNRCPMCGGGMYVSKSKGKTAKVVCTWCELSEVVSIPT